MAHIGPKLRTAIDRHGTLTSWSTEAAPRLGQVWFYHLTISNERPWSPAVDMEVKIIGLSKGVQGKKLEEQQISSLQLHWQWPDINSKGEAKIIVDQRKCDLCYLTKGQDELRLSIYVMPAGFRGSMRGGETMRLALLVAGANFVGKTVHVEIEWNGQWSQDQNEMDEHVHISDVSCLT